MNRRAWLAIGCAFACIWPRVVTATEAENALVGRVAPAWQALEWLDSAPRTLAELRGKVDASGLYTTRTELHELLAQAWDAAGRADLALPVPASPALIGVTLSAQALALLPGKLAFSAVRVAPVVL